jgi:hypothetical protein
MYGFVTVESDGGGADEYLKPDDFILQQFTGLLDCQGKEIYEGDIVRDVHDGFLDVSFGRYLDSRGMAHSGFHLNDMFGIDKKPLDGRLLVVGNIFEHDVTNDFSIVKR